MDNNQKKIIYFGAAGSAIAYCGHSKTLPDIFVDNDSKKWGSLIEEVEVHSPEILSSIQIEKIVITSGYVKNILKQLLKLGIRREFIFIPPKSQIEFHLFSDKQVRREASAKLYDLMNKFSVNANIVAVGGTALGFVREGDFLHWDGDIDLFAPLDSKIELINFLKSQGYKPNGESGSVMNSIKLDMILDIGITVPMSVDFFDSSSDVFTDTFEDYSWEWRTKMFTKCEKVKIHGKSMNVPSPPSEYLSQVYGASWSLPNPNFNYKDYNGKVNQF
jgi:hypothetical protein